MSAPFLGELRVFSFSFPPRGWALCNGQSLAISQNQALFALLGTTYGGNGVTTFDLPNLQSRVPLHRGQGPGLSNYNLGEADGVEAIALGLSETPAHGHPLNGTTVTATSASPAGNVMATGASNLYAANPANPVTLAPATLPSLGGGQPHENRQPLLVLSVCIALEGIFPARN